MIEQREQHRHRGWHPGRCTRVRVTVDGRFIGGGTATFDRSEAEEPESRSIVTDDFRCETGLQGIRIDYPRERRMSTVIFDISTSLDGSTAVKLPGNAINSETDEVIE